MTGKVKCLDPECGAVSRLGFCLTVAVESGAHVQGAYDAGHGERRKAYCAKCGGPNVEVTRK